MVETTRYRWLSRGCAVAALACVTLLAVGCGCQPKNAAAPTAKPAGDDPVLLCTSCGLIKGAPECCKTEGKAICSGCGLVKGSPGCCKIEKGSTAKIELCRKCGFIKGSTPCCKIAGKTICASCGLVKGSPGCCKIK